ncbi:MAG: toll/interleukin-1 receptor domain-containing protein [Thermoanaerobaculia bacterium]
MSALVMVVHAEGEEDLAEQLSRPIRRAGYGVALATDPDMLGSSADCLVVCGTAKFFGKGVPSKVLGRWNGREGITVLLAQMERDLFLQSNTDKEVLPFWLSFDAAALQLVSALRRNISIQEKTDGALRDQVFVSYCRKDGKWLNRLQIHLKPLERLGQISRWDDTSIDPGARWKLRIREAMSRAKVAVLLISADYLASDFVTSNELPPLLAAAETEGAIIIPVIISPCRFEKTEILSQFQSINPPSQPLIRMAKGRQEEIFVKVTEAIDKALRR